MLFELNNIRCILYPFVYTAKELGLQNIFWLFNLPQSLTSNPPKRQKKKKKREREFIRNFFSLLTIPNNPLAILLPSDNMLFN